MKLIGRLGLCIGASATPGFAAAMEEVAARERDELRRAWIERERWSGRPLDCLGRAFLILAIAATYGRAAVPPFLDLMDDVERQLLANPPDLYWSKKLAELGWTDDAE